MARRNQHENGQERLSIGVPEFAPYALSMRRKQGAGARFLRRISRQGRMDDLARPPGDIEVAKGIQAPAI